jgi:hypothetical protein
MKKMTPACFYAITQIMLSAVCANAADVMPIFENDTTAHNLSFNDTFGHEVVLGTYDPATGLWTAGGVAGGFTNLTVTGNATIAGTLGVTGITTVGTLNGISQTLTGTLGVAGVTTLGPMTATTGSFSSTLGVTGQTTVGALAASGAISGTGFVNWAASPPAIGATAPNTGKFTTLQATAITDTTSNFADNALSLASQGVDMTGATDTTNAFETALRSGKPLTCLGTFQVSRLVTVTNAEVALLGFGSANGCTILYTTAQSMVMLTETGNQLRTNNRVRIEHLKVIPQAAITSVTGATHTAAFDIEYPLGSGGTSSPTVQIADVQIMPSANANYILNGLYINDAVDVRVDKFTYFSEADTFNVNTSAVVYDGTHTPALITIRDSLSVYAGIGVNLVQENTGGWQGARIHDFDCLYSANCISARGSQDSTSDQLVVDGSEGPVQNYGVLATNVNHVSVHDNYFFLSNINIAGGTHATFPTCIEMDWTIAVGSNGASSGIHDNTCDGAQVTGYTGRYGVGVAGISRTNLNSHVGPNQLTNLEYGVGLTAGTAGFTVEKQQIKGVGVEFQNGGSAGDNTTVPPLASTDGSNAATGLVGERISSTVAAGSAVSLSNGVAKNMTSVTLTPGDWDCRGSISFLTNASTTVAVLGGSISLVSNTLPSVVGFFIDASFATGVGSAVPIPTTPIVLTAATTPVYLVAQSNFGVSTQAAYGTLDCRRMR